MTKTELASARVPVTVLLTNDHTAFLDEIAAAVRRNTGRAISRSALLRAFSAAVLPYFKDFLHCQSELQVTQRIQRRLAGGSR